VFGGDYFNGQPSPETDYLDMLLGFEPIAIGDLILTEVLQGFPHEKDYKTEKELLTSLTVFDLLGENGQFDVPTTLENCARRELRLGKP
jgi:hypothetical protein